jgi:hypothetical protein
VEPTKVPQPLLHSCRPQLLHPGLGTPGRILKGIYIGHQCGMSGEVAGLTAAYEQAAWWTAVDLKAVDPLHAGLLQVTRGRVGAASPAT